MINKKRTTRKKLSGLRVEKPSRFSPTANQKYITRGRVWLERDDELYVGRGRTMLLERIDRLGSIAAAARSMRLGYRNAWLWIESMNRLAPSPLVKKNTGGAGGGHTRLTEEGREAIAKYHKLFAGLQDFLKKNP
jgi:molybdate transport system regulatory protein